MGPKDDPDEKGIVTEDSPKLEGGCCRSPKDDPDEKGIVTCPARPGPRRRTAVRKMTPMKRGLLPKAEAEVEA